MKRTNGPIENRRKIRIGNLEKRKHEWTINMKRCSTSLAIKKQI